MPALDTTPAGADANAYLDVAAADALAAADVGRYATAWADADTTAKERAILRATRDVDAYVGYTDFPYAADQALLFPRWSDHDDDGLAVLPDVIVRATYEQAIYVQRVGDLIDDDATRRARGLSNFSEQNVSGALTVEPHLGQYAPRMRRLLDGPAIQRGGAVIGTIVRS
jgi:hypothetical protein